MAGDKKTAVARVAGWGYWRAADARVVMDGGVAAERRDRPLPGVSLPRVFSGSTAFLETVSTQCAVPYSGRGRSIGGNQ